MPLLESDRASEPVRPAPLPIVDEPNRTPDQQVRGAVSAGNAANALRLLARFVKRGTASQVTSNTLQDAFVAIVNDREVDEGDDMTAVAHYVAGRFPAEKGRLFTFCTQRGRTAASLAFV